jgi:hypothetical protein
MIIDNEIILTAAQLPSAPSATPASVTIAGNGRGAVASATPASVTVAMPVRSIGMALQGIIEEGGDEGDEVKQAVKDDNLPHTEGFFFGASATKEDDYYLEEKNQDIEIFAKAIDWMDKWSPGHGYRDVYYHASW